VFEEVAATQSNAEKRAKLEEMRTRDIAVYILQADYAEQKKEANKLRASERMKIVTEMAKKSDAERAVVGDLLKLGLAPYIITNQDREIFAREAERLQDMFVPQEEEEEIGVGQARDILEDGTENTYVATDNGDYGDYVPYPEGQDFPLPELEDTRSI
jgi:glucokinase